MQKSYIFIHQIQMYSYLFFSVAYNVFSVIVGRPYTALSKL